MAVEVKVVCVIGPRCGSGLVLLLHWELGINSSRRLQMQTFGPLVRESEMSQTPAQVFVVVSSPKCD